MKNDSTLFIGMDTHKELTDVVYSVDELTVGAEGESGLNGQL